MLHVLKQQLWNTLQYVGYQYVRALTNVVFGVPKMREIPQIFWINSGELCYFVTFKHCVQKFFRRSLPAFAYEMNEKVKVSDLFVLI